MDSFNGDPDDAIEVPELTPMDQYDAEKGRIKASISWLLCKAFQDNIPEEYGQPVHENLQGDLELKPVVQGGLTSADLYCKACANIFHDTSSQWKGHLSVMQSLSRKGVYVVDTNESGVTEQVLAQTSPLKLSSHLAVIEALMTAYCKEVVSIERVVQAVRQFASFHASSELPYDTEDALMFWLNKVCKRVWLPLDRNRISQEASQPPLVEDLLKDLNDGRSLGVLIYFYCPEAFSLQGLNVQEVVGIADSLYNLQEVIKFCRSWMPRRCLHLTLDDLFYTNENLKANLITFLSELFYNFEVSPIDCVKKPVMISPERSDDVNVGGPTRSGQRSSPGKPPAVPISNVTKKSFHYATNSGSHPDLHSLASSPGVNVPPVRQPLLPRRLHNRHSLVSDMRRSRSLTSAEDRDLIRGSVRAWEEGSLPGTAITTNGTSSLSQERSMAPKRVSSADVIAMSKDSATSSGTLLANVSIDSDASHDMTDNSIDISDLERHTRQSLGRGVHANDLELQSLSSRGTTAQSARNPHNPGHNPGPHKNPQESPAGYKVEPLMPAKLRPTKEKSSNHTKESERGDSQRKKSPVSPTKPLTLNLQPAKVTRDSDTDSTPDEAYQTPSTESVSFFGETTSSQPEATSSPAEQTSEMPKAKGQAFFINMDTMGNGVMGPPSQTSSFDRNKPVAQSFTLHDQIHTPEAARAAGIPVVDSHIPGILQTMRPGSMTRSSSDSSDQELKKIYADHRDSESKDKGMLSSPRPGYLNVAESQQSRVTNGPVSSDSVRPSGKPSPKTSFAEMSSKRLSGDFSPAGLVQANGGISTGTSGKSTKTPKKTTFAALPNQTTWQENAQKSVYDDGKNNGDDRTDSAQPLASELLNIRMRLEERRRQIENEKRKMGIQRNKQRQRVGKEAFIHVISKGKNGKELRGETAKIQEEKSPDSQPIKPEDAIDVEDEDEMPIPPYRPQGPVVEAEPDEAAPAERESKVRTPPKRPETRPTEVAEADVAAPAPRLPSPREKPVDSTSRLGRSFSREGIQDTINTVKKKWFGAEEKVETKREPAKKEDRKHHEPKVKSVEGKERKKPSSETQPKTSGRPAVRSRPISISQKDPSKKSSETYNNSLEKLNTSLSELQGEIMKLSLEQEQIKMAAKSNHSDSLPFSSEPMKVIAASPPRIAPSPPRVVPSPPRQDPFYLYPHQSGSEPEYGAKPASVPVASQMSGLGSQVYMTGQQVAPQYAPGMQQQTFMPPPTQMPYGGPQNYGQVNVSGGAGYMQMPHPYHQGMPPGGAPYQHMFPQQHMYPTPMPQGTGYPQIYQGQNQFTTPPQMQYTQPVSADQVLPSPTQTLYRPLSTSGSSPRAATTVQSPMDIRGMMSDLQAAQNGAPGLDVQSLQSVSAQSPQSPQVLSGSGITSPTGTPGITSPGSVYSPPSGSPQQRSPPAVASPAEGDMAEDAAAQNQPNEGFFISFDSESPRKQKPKLPSRNKKDGTQKSPNGKSSSSNGVTPDMAKAEPASSQHPKQTSPQRPAPVSPPGSPVNASPGVGFIVKEVSEDVPSTDEMEKKKNKIMEMQKKRREEQEKKRLQKEEKDAKKREKQRKKQEEAEQKKADEKARREAIYQQYLQRKTQQDVEEEAPEPPVVVRRQKGTKKKEARPKSCYPAIAATTNQDDVNSTSSPSHSSQEDLYRGRSPGPAGDFVRGNVLACSIPEGLDSMFGYGLGRLRVPSPNPKRAPSPSFRRPHSPSQPQPKSRNATGPKLFVKPNQKSNRHIIMNAISHCCLAGIVNQDVKTKVLNEISGSEAKHFLILFRDAGQMYRATYTYTPEREEIYKLSGVGPKQLTNKMIERFYKYNSGGKTFSEVTSTKHMSVSIDAVTIHNSLWQKKAPAQKRPQSHFSNF